jgi:methyl-accepting chemotaxis protein
MEKSGALTRDEAQKLAIRLINDARYSGKEYFWINDMNARMVTHPIKPELNGKDVSTVKDPDGNAVFVKFVEKVRTQGSGFVSYLWPKPGQEKPVEKVSYVAGFEPWGWVIGSGLYMDDLRDALYQDLVRLGIIVAVALTINFVLVRSVYRSITMGLHKAVSVARAIAGGDLSQELIVQGKDEVGQLIEAMKQMSDQLNATMRQVHSSASSLAQASAEIASGNHDLSQRTEQTASNLQQTAASMEELTGTVQQNAKNALHARECVSTASTVASEGGAMVSRVVGTMQGISSASRKIGDIIGVIDGIAFQTNILALNAAVEAARAGEQGRGFAVVATEVRMLAHRSAEAAKEIKSLINASVQQIDSGAQQVTEAGTTMQKIVSSVAEVNGLIQDITSSSGEQGEGIRQVNLAVGELDRMTQQNAALVEESTAAAESLRDQAESLAQAVSYFKLGPAAA